MIYCVVVSISAFAIINLLIHILHVFQAFDMYVMQYFFTGIMLLCFRRSERQTCCFITQDFWTNDFVPDVTRLRGFFVTTGSCNTGMGYYWQVDTDRNKTNRRKRKISFTICHLYANAHQLLFYRHLYNLMPHRNSHFGEISW